MTLNFIGIYYFVVYWNFGWWNL